MFTLLEINNLSTVIKTPLTLINFKLGKFFKELKPSALHYLQ